MGPLAWSTMAQTTPPGDPAPPTTPLATPDSGGLSGPTVSTATDSALTLIERDFSGSLRRLETSAEEAALAKLTLTAEEKSLTDTILRERAAILDGVVGKNTGLLVRLQGLRTAPTPDGRAALREMTQKLEPLRARGRLRDEIATALEILNQKRFVAMVDEYHDAILELTLEELRKEKPEATRAEAVARMSLLGVGEEIRRSYERTLAEKTGRLDAVIELLELTEAQEAKVRSIALEFGQKSLGKPTRAQIRKLLADVSAELTPEQRAKFVREIYESRVPAAAGTSQDARPAMPE
jgi:hypothetical protein